MRSRLKTNIKKQNYKTIIGIVLILFILIFFGTKLIIGLSVILEKFKSQKDNSVSTQSIDYIAPPTLNPIQTATSSAEISVSGFSPSNDTKINLYVNKDLVDNTTPRSDKSFTFENVNIKPGGNEIKVKAVDKNGRESDYSQPINVMYINKKPSLDINFPQDGQSFKKEESPIRISGKTDPGVKVTVNDFWAISNDDGTFFYLYPLKDGDNDLKIVATDDAGNQTTKEMEIKTE